jgi:hypothetical protein
MKVKFILAILAIVLVLAPVHSQAATGTNSLTTAIVQTIPGVGTFTGSITTTSFQVVNGVLNAVGTITGTLTTLTGQVLTVTNTPISVPILGLTGSCPILALHTGAISLSVLGLNVSLSPIDLTITATAAPGNLLGNLLCAVANLLNGNGSLAQLTQLLNQILGAL